MKSSNLVLGNYSFPQDLRTKKTVVRGCSESTLKREETLTGWELLVRYFVCTCPFTPNTELIAMRNTTKALKMYRKLQEKGL